MQSLIKCPVCGSKKCMSFYEPDNEDNVKCENGHTFKWEDLE
jgi:hypothetical protein